MHPATKALNKQLQSQSRCAPPRTLLADELQEAVANRATPLGLNRIHTNGQTLLPKATVTIVSREPQDDVAEGVIALETRALATALASAGHRVTLLVICGQTPAETPELRGVRVRHLQGKGWSSEELVRRAASLLRDHPCDVVHLQGCPGLASGLSKALQPHPPQLIVGLSDAGMLPELELVGLRQADWLISPSKAMANWAEQHLFSGKQAKQLIVNQSCPTTQELGPDEIWPLELSWQAFHERLPRRSTEGAAKSAEQTEATTKAEDSAPSGWRQLLNLMRGK